MSIGRFVCVLSCCSCLPFYPAKAEEFNCSAFASCEKLGYTVNASDCRDDSIKVLCPLDTSKAFCKIKSAETIKPVACVVGSVLGGDQLCYEAGQLPKSVLPVGIVFDETNKLALALSDVKKDGSAGSETMDWAGGYVDIHLLTNCKYEDNDAAVDACDTNGRTNTTTILGGEYYCYGVTAAKAVNAYHSTNCSKDFCQKNKWFLPSMRDLGKIYANKSVINASLNQLNSFGAKNLTESCYWSSTEYSDSSAWAFYMDNGNRYYEGKNAEDYIYVRPVIYYGEETAKKTAPLPILYGDGTVDKTVLTEKYPIGIVFDETNRLAIALADVSSDDATEFGEINWANGYHDIPSLENCNYEDGKTTIDSCGGDGATNTDAILTCGSRCRVPTSASACKAYLPYGCMDSFCKDGKWFLPSMKELAKVYAKKNKINNSMGLLKRFEAQILTESCYWSSVEKDADNAWGFCISDGSRIWEYKVQNMHYVRPVIKY